MPNPAKIEIFNTAACLVNDELAELTPDGIYIKNYGNPVDGIDNLYELWAKNTGDVAAPNVVVKDISDPRNYVLYSKDGTAWADTASLGEIVPGAVKKYMIKIFFPFGATVETDVQAYHEVGNY